MGALPPATVYNSYSQFDFLYAGVDDLDLGVGELCVVGETADHAKLEDSWEPLVLPPLACVL